MKKITSLLCAVAMTVVATAQTLKFDPKGEFKIVQFTDVHFRLGDAKSDISLKLINETLDAEKPDLVVFSGDIVVDTRPAVEGWKVVLEPLQKREVPYAIVMGNHDDECGTPREEILSFLETQKGSLTRKGDYTVEINGKNGNSNALLYLFDSNSYSTVEGVDGYGWITLSQVQNYVETSRKFTAANNGKPLPALAFMHIPLSEYRIAIENREFPLIGQRNEDECAPMINTGLFAAMRIEGDVMGCFAGHDHVNDYTSYLYDIALCYGRFSGSGTTYGELRNGARIITLREGVRGFNSYIRERGGEIVQRSTLPRTLNFLVTSDTHFDMPPETDQYKNVMAINRVAMPLDGTAIVGDIFDHQHSSIVELFKQRYEKGKGDSTLHSQLYIGLGNHDINPSSENPQKNIEERTITLQYVDSLLAAMKEDKRISNLHKPTRNYSWNLNGIHFIQTHTYAGDSTLGSGGLKWLADDLKRSASKQQPVILLMHYTFKPNYFRWIDQKAREELASVLKGYNILAIFNGHDHHSKKSEFQGIPVYTTDNAWKDSKEDPSFYHIEYSPQSGLSVTKVSWDNATRELSKADF